jgi:dipeptidyl-peptidase III
VNYIKPIFCLFFVSFLFIGQKEVYLQEKDKPAEFKVQTEQFADLAVLRYRIPGFESLTLKQKEFLYYLTQAAMSGRDIFYDQNYKYNLVVRRTLEGVVKGYKGDRNAAAYADFMIYAKRFWFSNGIHHHYAELKFVPTISKEYFANLVKNTPKKNLPLKKGQSVDAFLAFITPIIFDPAIASVKANQAAGADVIATSANNFYEGLTQKEVEDYYNKRFDKKDPEPISIGLNSKLMKKNGKIIEKTWKVGGMYSAAIKQIVYWLEKALPLSETAQQKKSLSKLIEFYKTGSLKAFDEYSIEWVKDTEALIDITNGFIETYGDPLNYKATYESVVSFKDLDATKRIAAISNNAQWFEDNSSIAKEHKKKEVKGISAKVITVVAEAGDCSPSTPIGINLPNATWIRKEYGSKSVNLGNIVHAYNEAASEGALKEFAGSQDEIDLIKKYGDLSDDLHTDMHEVIGHASGQINAGIGTPRETLKNYASTIEEARADLVALYYIIDQKLVDIGVSPSTDLGKAEYYKYMRNGLMTQLMRIKPGENVEEAHMRNRQLIARWAYEKGKADKVVEFVKRDGKTYVAINDFNKLRKIFGEMLKEIQRVTSEGDYTAAQNLVETYGVKVDKDLHKEILERFAKLNVAPYKGFINPELVPVMKNGKIVDVTVSYPDDFTKQMLGYGEKYSFLPNEN